MPSYGVNYKRLVSLYEQHSPEVAGDLLQEAFSAKEIRADNIDAGRLFVECFGWHEFQACRSKNQTVMDVLDRALQEAEGAVSRSAFLNINYQIVYSTVMDEYMNEDAQTLLPLIPEQDTQFLDGEKIPGLSQIGDEVAIRDEGEAYAPAGFTEDWINTPTIRDRGMNVALTWEAVFQDRTGLMLQRAKDVAKWARINRLKRMIDCIVDENTTAHRYKWRGTTIASYGDNSGTHTWDNLAATNGLSDWTNLNTAEQVFNAILDPYTGEPVVYEPKHLVVYKGLEQTAARILRQGTIRYTTPGFDQSNPVSQHTGENNYSQKYQLITSRWIATRLATDTDWFLGDLGEYAKYMVAERLNVQQAPPNSYEEYHRRIVQQFRVNERGAYVVVQPRAVVKSTVS